MEEALNTADNAKLELKKEALEAAGKGNIDELYRLVEKNPQLLDYFDNVRFVHSPLHEAAKTGQRHFAIEAMNLKPSLARKLNCQGLSPLDLAVIEDHTDETETPTGEEQQSNGEKRKRKNETAKALIKLDRGLIRVKGKNMMTPMHHAVMENNVDLLAEFLCACPGSIGDRTNRFQTAVHLAVENKKPAAFDLLLGWLKRRNKLVVLSKMDEDGNNALHIAVQTEQDEIVRKLVWKIPRTSRNLEKLTPLDIAEQKQNNIIKHLLIAGCGVRNTDHDMLHDTETLPEFLKSKEGFVERHLRLFFHSTRELPLEIRNVILVVAALIVTAAFQGMLSPPGGLWQGNGNTTANAKAPAAALDMYNFQRRRHNRKQVVGKAVTSPLVFNEFMVGNTVAFISATAVIFLVIPSRPYSILLFISLIFLTYSYLKAMLMISEPSFVTWSLIIITWCSTFASFTYRFYVFLMEALFFDSWYWMPRFAVLVINFLYQLPISWPVNRLFRCIARFKLQHKVCSFELSHNAKGS